MKVTRLISLVTLGAAAAVGFSGGAVAQAPAAEGCNGLHIKDTAGDQSVGPILGNSPVAGTGTSKGPDNMDITGVFFEHRNGVTTANLRIANLTKDVPPEIRTGALSYQVEFNKTEEGDVVFVRAELKNGQFSFTYATGERVETPASTQDRPVAPEIATEGSVVEGPNGLISIKLPDVIAKPGTKLENVYGIVSQRSEETQYVGYANDTAPDAATHAGEGKDYTVVPCQEAPAPVVTAPQVETPAPPAQSNPGSSQPSKPPAKASKRAACQKKAKKIKNKRKRAAALKKCKKVKG
jgi:hypothetical protein